MLSRVKALTHPPNFEVQKIRVFTSVGGLFRNLVFVTQSL